jgi:hypothetical protein
MFACSWSGIPGGMLISGIWMVAFGKDVLALSTMFLRCVWNDRGGCFLLLMPTLNTSVLGVVWGGNLGSMRSAKCLIVAPGKEWNSMDLTWVPKSVTLLMLLSPRTTMLELVAGILH